MKIVKVIVPVSLTVAGLLASCIQLTEKHEIQGELVIPEFSSTKPVGTPCSGNTSDIRSKYIKYNDINLGTQIVIKNSQSNIVGVGTLEQGTLDKETSDKEFPNIKWLSCSFPFTVKNLPKSNFYTVEIGNRNTRLTFPVEELEQKDWHVILTLS